jgi:hypothetical protein
MKTTNTNTHTGKIGRLPKDIRHQLGLRLEDGLPATKILHWLNGLPEVQAVLTERFGGKPISEQNLSHWRLAGHLDWLRRQEVHQMTQDLLEQAGDLTGLANGQQFGKVLSAEIMTLGMLRLRDEADREKRWLILCDLRRELSLLRRDDDRGEKVMIQREQWDREVARLEAEAEEARKARQREEAFDLISMPQNAYGRPDRKFLLGHYVRFDKPIQELLDQWKIDTVAAEAIARLRAEAEAKVQEAAEAKARKEAERKARDEEEVRLDAEYQAQLKAKVLAYNKEHRPWALDPDYWKKVAAGKTPEAAPAAEETSAEKAEKAQKSNQIQVDQTTENSTATVIPEPASQTEVPPAEKPYRSWLEPEPESWDKPWELAGLAKKPDNWDELVKEVTDELQINIPQLAGSGTLGEKKQPTSNNEHPTSREAC